MVETVSARGEPFDLVMDGWAGGRADGGSFLGPRSSRSDIRLANRTLSFGYLDERPSAEPR
jgi:hypothetical protein